ncbi:fibronectin-binding protein [Nitzschia inconspicua]|uniref:Fibronectin-binding protein n=2 Tax=Nitzschia inconspicua TaxID=303405 RepID=A0A9K3K4X7_9STRA|nr:fibronectin-binding protein [Nitzschia inconspicua]
MVKSKVRFDGLDVAATVAHWNRVALGRRVINIYNGPNGDTYIFKLDKRSNDDATTTSSSNNLLLLMESGVRFHTSYHPYENPGMPSPFCAKLRKHLRGLRLEQVTQLGNMDRVVHLVFGSGDAQRHSLMLEFYARGNIVLTNSSYTILSLLRSHEYTNNNQKEGEGGDDDQTKKNDAVQVKVGHAYPVTYATTLTAENAADSDEGNTHPDENAILLTAKDPLVWFQKHKQSTPTTTPEQLTSNKKKKKNDNHSSSQNAWKTLLLTPNSGVAHFGPSLLEHCLRCADLWGVDKKLPSDMTTTEEWTKLQMVLQQQGGRILDDIQTKESKGYLLYQEKKKNGESKQDEKEKNDNNNTPPSPFDDKILLEFQPHLLLQHQDMPRLEYDTFDRAVDVFFSHIESQKRMLRVEQQQAQAEQRLQKIRLDQEQRMASLMEQQELLQEQARLVELHADMVEKALQVVNSALDSGMDWEQLEDLVELEKSQNHNPVALLIHKLDLEHDQMVLRLTTEDVLYEESDNDDEKEVKPLPFRDVTVSLNETAHGNATALFAKYRASKEKSQKTIEASAKALEAAEENAKKQLMEAQSKRSNVSIQAKRKPLWFEKFNWFVTSDNYLVLGGRDAQQNELLVKRYLRPGDAYLHADVHGAASCILRAKRRRDPKTGKTSPIPLSNQALREAGNFTICRSSAWSSRMVTSAWWVESHQVSKTAPTGEYLTVGSFMIRGKKNFLPPSQLEMGLGVLFRLGDDDSILRHKNERRDFALMQLDEDDGSTLEDDISPVVIKRVEKKVELPSKPRVSKAVNLSGSSAETNGALPTEKSHLDSPAEEPPETIDDNLKVDHFEESQHIISPGRSGDADQNVTSKTDASLSKKKGLSVKERKLIKKYGSLEAAKAIEEERQRQDEAMDDASETSSVASQQTSQPGGIQTKHKRGKKTKMKRVAKKYADQDDDDRELALLLLQGGEKEKHKDKRKVPLINEREKEAAAETLAILTKDSAAIAAQLPEKVRDTLAKCVAVSDSNDGEVVKWGKFDGDVLEQLQVFELEEQMQAAADRLLALKGTSRIDNFSASLAGIIRTIKKYGHEGLNNGANGDSGGDGRRKNKSEKEAEEESWKKTLADEGILDGGDEDDEGVDDTAEISKLTGKPQNEDLLLFAVPVCAPYQTLSQYAYRVKLTPGNMKRGKASKQCVDMFLKDGAIAPGTDRYRELIKKVLDNEWVQSICGDVKISAAGAAKAIQKSKAKVKGGKKK